MGMEQTLRLGSDFLSNADLALRVVWTGGDYSTGEFESLSCSDKITPAKVPGFGNVDIGRTRGKYEADDAKLAMYFEAFCELQEALGLKADAENKALGDVDFEIHGFYQAINSDRVIPIRLEGCRLIGRSLDSKAGDSKPEVMQWPVSVMRLWIDGRCLGEKGKRV